MSVWAYLYRSISGIRKLNYTYVRLFVEGKVVSVVELRLIYLVQEALENIMSHLNLSIDEKQFFPRGSNMLWLLKNILWLLNMYNTIIKQLVCKSSKQKSVSFQVIKPQKQVLLFLLLPGHWDVTSLDVLPVFLYCMAQKLQGGSRHCYEWQGLVPAAVTQCWPKTTTNK